MPLGVIIWQMVIVDGGDPLRGGMVAAKARLAALIADTQVRLALGFCLRMEPDMQEDQRFNCAITPFQPERVSLH